MRILDAQVHAYERNHPGRPWRSHAMPGPQEITGDEMVVAMDAVGVSGALLVSPMLIYGYDASYALAVLAKHPSRFRVVKPIDPAAPDVEEAIAEWAETPGAVGVRLLLMGDAPADPADPGLNRALAAAGRRRLPVNIQCWGRLAQFAGLAARHPDTVMIVDHLGLPQPGRPPAPDRPFAELPKVLELAAFANVAIKLTGACTLSHQPFPFADLWEPLGRILDAFGPERCLWGSDWTRATELLTYSEAVDAFRLTDRLSPDEREMVMGGALARIYGWPA